MASMPDSPCREGRDGQGRIHLALRLSAIPEEGPGEGPREGPREDTRHLPHAPPSPASSMAAPLSPPPPSIPPPWDRSCDAGVCSAAREKTTYAQTQIWQQSVAAIYALFGRAKTQAHSLHPPHPLHPLPLLLQLPLTIRHRICCHLAASSSEHQPIRMNALVFTRAVWGPDAFSSLAEDLGPLQGALSASFALRAEVLAALFGTRRFHVVFSPYVRPAVCPLATLYLPRYGHLIRNMTLELDCTRLGYGMHPAAAGLQPGLLSMGALVAAFVESVVSAASPQGETDAAPPLDSLNVLCRRYYGNRPASCAKVDEGATPAAAAATATAITTTPADMPYVGPEVERVAGQLRQLAGLASSVRFVGFSEAFTLEMLATVGGRNKGSEGSESSERSVHIWRRSPSDFYPLLPGHSAYVDCGPELGICLLSHTALSLLLCPSTKGSTKRSEHGDADDDDNDDDDDVKTIFISDTSTSTPVSTPVSINSPALTKRTTALSLAHLAHLHDARPRLAVLPSKPAKACRQGRRRGPTFLALFGFCQQQQQGQLRQQQRPSSLVGVQLAAVGLAVGAVGSPLRLSKNGFKGGRGRVAGNGMTMDEESRIVDEVASVCLDDLKEQCVGQDPSQPQDKQEEEQQQQQHRPRRRLQKRRYDQQPSLVWSW